MSIREHTSAYLRVGEEGAGLLHRRLALLRLVYAPQQVLDPHLIEIHPHLLRLSLSLFLSLSLSLSELFEEAASCACMRLRLSIR